MSKAARRLAATYDASAVITYMRDLSDKMDEERLDQMSTLGETIEAESRRLVLAESESLSFTENAGLSRLKEPYRRLADFDQLALQSVRDALGQLVDFVSEQLSEPDRRRAERLWQEYRNRLIEHGRNRWSLWAQASVSFSPEPSEMDCDHLGAEIAAIANGDHPSCVAREVAGQGSSLSDTEFMILHSLSNSNGSRSDDIVRKLKLEKATWEKCKDGLVNASLIKTAGPCGWRITAAGIDVLKSRDGANRS